MNDSRKATRRALRRLAMICPLAFAVTFSIAEAKAADGDSQLLQELRALRAEQTRIAELQERNSAAIAALESRLGVAAPQPTPAAAATAPAAAQASSRLKVSGDLRLRSQFDTSDDDRRDRSSAQIRARLGATYAINDRVTIGGRIVTGDSDDPNSTDVQISNWDDDLGVALDLAYGQFSFGDVQLYAGKFPMPFVRTDLVWDGDVNPQGVGSTYRHALPGGGTFLANASFFLVDEQAVAADTTMGGIQVGYASAPGSLKYDAAVGYYRYSIGNLAGADSGDWRTNRLGPDGRYLSDFHLLDVVLGATWQGPSEAWPLRVTADYVRNLGAIDDEDTGYGVDLSFGRASKAGDWRFTYGYSRADVDAVLAAFSQDNISIGTNYRLHSLTAEYTPAAKTTLGAIWYHYRPDNPAYAGSNTPDDWLDRFRVYFLMSF